MIKTGLLAVLLLVASSPVMAQRTCDKFASGTQVGNSLAEKIPGSAGLRIYLCGWVMINNSSQDLAIQLLSGTGTNCGTNQTVIMSSITLPNSAVLVNRIAVASGEYTAQGHSLCVQTTGAGSLSAIFYWAQF